MTYVNFIWSSNTLIFFVIQNGSDNMVIIGPILNIHCCDTKRKLKKFCKARLNSLSANFTKWWNTLKQFVGNLPTNCLSVFDHFVGFALNGLTLVLLGTSQRFFFCLSLTVTTIANLLKYFWFALIFRGDYKSFLTILYVASRY